MSFASGPAPEWIADLDLQAEVEESVAHSLIADDIVSFFTSFGLIDEADTAALLEPVVAALEMEGNSLLKPACDGIDNVNPYSPMCFHGSAWTNTYSQRMMGGDLLDGITLHNNDNLHVGDGFVSHFSSLESGCESLESGESCSIETVTISENLYIDDAEITYPGAQFVSAYEIKTKMTSRQQTQIGAGNTTAVSSYKKLDTQGTNCQEINEASIEWAYNTLSDKARYNYDTYGAKIVAGKDLRACFSGP